METQEVISRVREYYQGTVKPLIKEGRYELAEVEMGNLNIGLVHPNKSKIKQYHSGPNFVGLSSILEKIVNNSSPGELNNAVKFFEAFLAQVELASKSNNIFY